MYSQTLNIKAYKRSLLKRKVTRLARMWGDNATKTLVAGAGVLLMGTFFAGMAVIQ